MKKLIIVSNFNEHDTYGFELGLPEDIIQKWNLKDGEYQVEDQLYKKYKTILKVENNQARVRVDLKPLESFILKIKK